MTLNDIFPAGGVFAAMQSPPWPYDGADMDLQFMSEFGERAPSLILSRITGDVLATQDAINTVARLLLLRFGESWRRKYAVLEQEYNPIENYNSTETETATRNTGESGTEGITHTHNDTDTTNNTETRDLTQISNASGEDAIHGFNSTAAVPDREQKDNATDTDTGTITTAGSTQRSGTSSDNKETTNTEETSENRTLTRKGNIGVTTTQQMLTSELELWNWNYINDVMRDAANLLTLPIYATGG